MRIPPAAALSLALLFATGTARAMGSVRTELDRESVPVGEPFALTFLLPPDCPFVDVPLAASGRVEIVSKNYDQAGKFALVKLADNRVQQGVPRSSGRVVYILKSSTPGILIFDPIRVKCGASIGETFRRQIRVLPGPPVEAAAPEAAPKPEGISGEMNALQNFGKSTSENQMLDKELAALPKPAGGPNDLAYQAMPESQSKGFRLFLETWRRRMNLLMSLFKPETFGVSSAAAPYVVGGLFLFAVAALIIGDWISRILKRRRAAAALPQMAVRGRTPPENK